MKDTHIRKSLEDGLSALSYTEQQHREMLNRIVYGGKSKVKKKASFSLVLAVVLALVTITGALAATGAFEKIMEVWQNSFEKMNTTNELFELVDEEEYDQIMEDKGKEGIKEDYVHRAPVGRFGLRQRLRDRPPGNSEHLCHSGSGTGRYGRLPLLL